MLVSCRERMTATLDSLTASLRHLSIVTHNTYNRMRAIVPENSKKERPERVVVRGPHIQRTGLEVRPTRVGRLRRVVNVMGGRQRCVRGREVEGTSMADEGFKIESAWLCG